MKKLTIIILLTLISKFNYAQLKEVIYKDNNQQLKGLVTSKKSLNKGVLILPAWKGIDDEAKQAALDLEKEGYIAFIADIYGDGKYPKDNTEAKNQSSYYKENYTEYQHRIKLALNELIKQGANPKNIAIIGYCFGGTGALEAARAQLPINGVVSIHGGLSKNNRLNTPITTKVLVLHGADDQSVPETDVTALKEELKNNNTDWQLIYYANSKHTFTNPQSADYNKTMALRAWNHLLIFLKEIL